MSTVRTRLRCGISLSLVAVGACNAATTVETTGNVRLRTALETYSAGSPVRVTIENADAVDYGYTPCPVSLRRQVGGGWQDVSGGVISPTACDLILVRSAAGQTQTVANIQLATGLQPGTYQLLFETVVDGAGKPLPASSRVTNPFTIR